MISGLADRADLLRRLHETVVARADHAAVRESAGDISYAQLGQLIGELARAFYRPADPRPIGLLLERSALAYAAMWAAVSLGRPYVPLNPRYPRSRLQRIIDQAGIGALAFSDETVSLADQLDAHGAARVHASRHRPSTPDTEGLRSWWQLAEGGGDTAYILFTSGSTGEPKGVPVSYANLIAFVNNAAAAIPCSADDICSQVCELSFDVSVQEIYLALLSGSTLCPVRPVDLFNPARFVADRRISLWTSVPSLAHVVLNNGVAVGDSLESIRTSIFNGETLTRDLARAWQAAAPHTQIINTYGPTECTVAVCTLPWRDEAGFSEQGGIAIGRPFPDCRTGLLIDDRVVWTDDAAPGAVGELLLTGPQLFGGYLDRKLTSPFVTADDGTVCYRTGDRVLWRDQLLFVLGRMDLQVKIGGHRIEILEIEHHLRRHLGTNAVAVVASPKQHPMEMVLFLADHGTAGDIDREGLGLPTWMLPKRTVRIEALPLTAHGKLDRAALQAQADGTPVCDAVPTPAPVPAPAPANRTA